MIDMPNSAAAESFRDLRTNLLRGVERGEKKILFSSPWPNDGKSIVCANVAVAFAQISKRVILVDVDLRRSTLGNLFSLADVRGLADALEEDLAVEPLLQVTGVPNLRFLPGGTLTTSPADRMSGPRMRRVVRELDSLADCILLDSPPLSMFAEGKALSSLVDGVVLIINPGRWKGEPEMEIKRGLEEAGAKIVGLVLNEVDAKDGGSYRYGYGYGYGQGGYGEYGGHGSRRNREKRGH